MNPKLVTSLKLSRELKELGVKQESLFSWVNLGVAKGDKEYPNEKWVLKMERVEGRECYSAFLSGELGEMLPSHWFNIEKGSDRWYVNPAEIPDESFIEGFHYQADKNLAEALGKMLAYLIKNKLIKR